LHTLEIEKVEVIPLRIPLTDSPIHRFGGDNTGRAGFGCIAVYLHTKDGPSGFGYTFQTGGNGTTAVAAFVRDGLAPRIVGQDALAPEALWHRLWSANKPRMRAGLGVWALSAVDIACWDIVAKVAGLPLHTLLGGYRRRVPVYGSGGLREFSDAELLAECRDFAAQGIGAYKIKIGGMGPEDGHSSDEGRIALLRREMGDDFVLYVDGSQNYSPSEAIEVSAMLRHHGVAWFEEPTLADSVDDLGYVASRSAVPIAAGENAYLRWGFRELCTRHAVAVLQPDVGVCGGVTEFRKVAHLAESFNLALCSHLAHELSVSLIGASSSGSSVEYAELLPPDFWVNPIDVADGHLTVPDVPGHGVDLHPGARARYALGSFSSD
jgi:L-alanine-DL-glutamate epimerase-like enolase superfamily enzyme